MTIRVITEPGRTRVVTGTEGKRGPAGSQTITVALSLTGEIDPGELLARLDITDAFTPDPDRCSATCDTAPTADVELALTLDGDSFGTITFPEGLTQGTITLTEGTVQGLLRLTAPTDPAALADVSITIAGDR